MNSCQTKFSNMTTSENSCTGKSRTLLNVPPTKICPRALQRALDLYSRHSKSTFFNAKPNQRFQIIFNFFLSSFPAMGSFLFSFLCNLAFLLLSFAFSLPPFHIDHSFVILYLIFVSIFMVSLYLF